MISWAILKGYKWLRSSGLNYDPKLHLRHVLDPTDLYVRHTSVINAVAEADPPLDRAHAVRSYPQEIS